MPSRQFLLLLAALGLAGCDRLSGEADRKNFDAEAIGYACRVSLRVPEDCMKANEAHSPTSILAGWKKANKDIEENVIDPSMGQNRHEESTPQSAPAAAESAPAAAPENTEKPATEGKQEAAKTHKPEKH